MLIKRIILPWFCAACAVTVFALLVCSGGAVAATQQESLHKAIQDFEAMTKDQRRSMWRDSWENLEKRFAAIQKQSPDFAAEAYFYRARSLEELAERSKNSADAQSSARLYAAFADEYSRHPLADNAMYNQAMLLSGPLKNQNAARAVLDKLILLYPDGDMQGAALTLRERLEGASAPAGAAARPAQSASGAQAAAPAPSTPATAQQVTPQSSTPAQSAPSATGNALEQQRLYKAAASQWRTLLSDSKKSALRDNWLSLEKDFQAALKAAPQGADAPKAAYQTARCREELAKRSARKDDWSAAVKAFGEAARQYPASSLADDALYAQAEIMSAQLSQKGEARAVLEDLLARYPKGDMKDKAQKLLKTLPAAPTGSTAVAPPAKSAPAPAPTPAVTATHKVKGNTGSKTAKAPASGALLRYMEWSGDTDSLTLTIELAGRAKYRRNTLAPTASPKTPLRARIDILGTDLDRNVRQSVILTGVPLGSINVSKQSGNITRVELDLGNARSYKVSVLQNPYRLQVEISRDKVLPGAEDLRKIAPSQPRAATNGNLVEQLGLSIKTVVIDAGHGGKDPGAVGNGLRESSITLDLASKLGEQLKKQGFNVIYTRDANRYVALEDRTSLANSRKADLFISVHVNSSTNKKLSGLETYYLDVARSDAAALVAARENSVNINATSDLQFILSDLTRNSKKEESLAVSKLVHQSAIKRLGARGFKMRDNGVRSAPFHVLMGARMPAFLIEVGYLSHSNDAARLKNPKYIQAMAEGICEGIVAYRKKINAMTAR